MATKQVFEIEESLYFVMDEVDSETEAGGCTQDWWDTSVAAIGLTATMAKLVDATGTPVINATGCDYVAVTDRIEQAGVGIGVEAGMVAYVIQAGAPGVDVDTGRYIIEARGDDWLDVEDIDGADVVGDIDVIVGGAFDDLQNACDKTDATDKNCSIHVQSTPVLATSLVIDSGAGYAGGNNTKNTFKKILGFNTVPGDMDRGGAFYESPFDMLDNGTIDATKTVLIDANDGAYEVLNIAEDNMIFENLHLTNNNEITAAILFTGFPQNIRFTNCRFSHVLIVSVTIADYVVFDSCFTKDFLGNGYSCRGHSNLLLNCVSIMAAGTNWCTVVSIRGTTAIGCVAIGGEKGIRCIGHNITAINNTFYNQTVSGVSLEGATMGVVHNNIFMLFPGAIGFVVVAAGSFVYNDYNCFIESDGTPLTVGVHITGGSTAPVMGPHSIEADPMFVNAANNNFRLDPGSPCRRTGHPTVGAT